MYSLTYRLYVFKSFIGTLLISLCLHVLYSHTALKPKQLQNFFEPVFKQAEDLQQAYASCGPTKKPNFRVPFVTVSATLQS